MRLRGKHVASGQLTDVIVQGEMIASVVSAISTPADHDAEWISPALFDLQINGCNGFAFNSPELSIERVRHIVGVCHKQGIAALCPTLITGSAEALCHGFRTLARACDNDRALDRALPVFHLEGPYISPDDGPRGAHPLRHVRSPSWDEFRRFQGAAAGRIRLITLAPETEGALPFIEKLVASGVIVSLGHTAAEPRHIRQAIEAGATLSTHLGNGSHALLPRHENYFLEQLAADDLWASIICDGHHLPASLMRIIVRVKGPKRLIITSDAGPLAGLPPGRYRDWDQEFEVVPEGKIVVPGTSFLAGSWAFTDACVANMANWGNVTLSEAIDMASVQPRRLLGLRLQTLEANQPADVMLFNWQPGGQMKVVCTVIAGKVQ